MPNDFSPDWIDEPEDTTPPYKKALEEVREAERELERSASGGLTADEEVGSNGERLVVGDVATIEFLSGKKAFQKTGTLLCVGGGITRVRLNGSKDPLGTAFPCSRVSTNPFNGGRPLKTKAEKKTAAEHALHMKEYEDAIREGRKPSPSNGADHTAEDETAPLPKRVLKGHNGGVSEGILYMYIGRCRALDHEIASLQGRRRELNAKMKDDGVEPGVLKRVMGELKLAPEELVDQINIVNSYRAAVHLPNHGPIDSPEVPDAADAAKRQSYAREQGSLAGFRGAAGDTNPWPDPSDACHLAWHEGWSDAQGKLLMRGITKA